MKLMTISEVTKTYNVTTRMLRYYDEIGLLPSTRKEDYAYRVYDEAAIRRLQQILTLRKLRIPLKKIAIIIKCPEQREIINVLQQSINELNDEISALQRIREILEIFVVRINSETNADVKLGYLNADSEILSVIRAFSLSKSNFKEDYSMDDLITATEILGKNINVRIVLLPPCTVASYHYVGENPEETVGDVVDKFVRESKLYEIKPDARMFGFNHPNPSEHRKHHGYEDWVTIPDEMEVPKPLVKKIFKGGLYAAYAIDFPNFHEWKLLINWVTENDSYCADYSELGEEIMHGCLEEHLNWVYASHLGWPENRITGKLDLLCPIQHKQNI